MGKRLNDTAALAARDPANRPRTHAGMKQEWLSPDRQGIEFGAPGQDVSPDRDGPFTGVSKAINGE